MSSQSATRVRMPEPVFFRGAGIDFGNHRKGGYYPLDERLGVNKCGGFSPFMTFLQVLFGATRPFEESAELLSKALGFSISSTAVQWNTEHAGGQLADDPYGVIEELIVEMDSTTSPQIQLRKSGEGVDGGPIRDHGCLWAASGAVLRSVQEYRKRTAWLQ